MLVIGGGVVGVELAAELAHYHPRAAVTVADVAPRLLATLPPAAGERAAAALRAAGVALLLGAPLRRTDGKLNGAVPARYVTPGGETLDADVVFACVGARPNSAALRGVPLDERGCVPPPHCRLTCLSRARVPCLVWLTPAARYRPPPAPPARYVRVDARWRVAGADRVYAIGDLAAKPPAQALGSYAHWEAEYVARDIRRAWRGAPPARYAPPPQLVNVSLGPRRALFFYDGALLLFGWPAAALKALTQAWFVGLLPIPYVVLRWLPRLAGGAATPAPAQQQQQPGGAVSAPA